MKYIVKVDNKQKCELPGNLNRDTMLDVLKIYLFNEEYNNWKEFKLIEVNE